MRYLVLTALVASQVFLLTLRNRSLQWAVYYADAVPAEQFEAYDFSIFDSDAHPSLEGLRRRGRSVLGYLSVGEVENHRAYYESVKRQGILLFENETWKGSFFVDVRDDRWRRRVTETLIPAILAKGFNGVFLDTVDNASFLESQQPEKFRGMSDAMVELIRDIRVRFPKIKLAVNRGFDILPRVDKHVDIVMGESVYTTYDFAAKVYRFVEPDLYRKQVEILHAAQRRNPNLTVITLDYWNPSDEEGLRHIYSRERANGFHPYVSTIELDRLIAEPGF